MDAGAKTLDLRLRGDDGCSILRFHLVPFPVSVSCPTPKRRTPIRLGPPRNPRYARTPPSTRHCVHASGRIVVIAHVQIPPRAIRSNPVTRAAGDVGAAAWRLRVG